MHNGPSTGRGEQRNQQWLRRQLRRDVTVLVTVVRNSVSSMKQREELCLSSCREFEDGAVAVKRKTVVEGGKQGTLKGGKH